jgi:hypothetical protein
MCTHKEKSMCQPYVYMTFFISPLAEEKHRQCILLNGVTFRELWLFFIYTYVTFNFFISNSTWVNLLLYIFEINQKHSFIRKQNFHLLKSSFYAYCQNDTYDDIKSWKSRKISLSGQYFINLCRFLTFPNLKAFNSKQMPSISWAHV